MKDKVQRVLEQIIFISELSILSVQLPDESDRNYILNNIKIRMTFPFTLLLKVNILQIYNILIIPNVHICTDLINLDGI